MPGVKNNKRTSSRKRASGRTSGQARSVPARRKKSGRKSSAGGEKILLVSLLAILACAILLLGWSYSRFRSGTSNERNLTKIAYKEVERTTPAEREEPDEQVVFAEEMKLGELSLGGLSYEDALAKIEKEEKKLLSKLTPVKLKGGEEEIAKTPYQLGLRLDIDAIIKRAEEENAKKSGRNPILDPIYRVDEEALAAAVEDIREEIDQEGKDAEATGFDPSTMQFIFTKEQEGRMLDVDDTKDQVRDLLEKEDFARAIKLKIERTPAGRTAEEMSANISLIASASTPIMYYSEGRNHNVQLAADRINGTILQPGESFSYNTTIGPMTEASGFVLAGIQDEFGNDSLGIGGGLCQPSTTIYQAAVRAGMRIDVHHFHTTPVTYCPIGMDAMVTIGADLVFTNVSAYPVTIMAYFDQSNLTFNFYGPARNDGIEYDLYVEELDSEDFEGEPLFTKDESLAPGATEVRIEPRPIRHVKVYRKTYQNGVEIASELMYDHKYPGGGGVIAGNMDELPPQNASEPETTPIQESLPDPMDTGETSEETSVILYYVYDQFGNLVPVYAAPTAAQTLPQEDPQPSYPQNPYYYYP